MGSHSRWRPCASATGGSKPVLGPDRTCGGLKWNMRDWKYVFVGICSGLDVIFPTINCEARCANEAVGDTITIRWIANWPLRPKWTFPTHDSQRPNSTKAGNKFGIRLPFRFTHCIGLEKRGEKGSAIRDQTTCHVWPNSELIGMPINYEWKGIPKAVLEKEQEKDPSQTARKARGVKCLPERILPKEPKKIIKIYAKVAKREPR